MLTSPTGTVNESSYYSSRLVSYHLVSSDLTSYRVTSFFSEMNALWLVAVTANWGASRHTRQFTVTATNHSTLSSYDVMLRELRSNSMRWDEWYKRSLILRGLLWYSSPCRAVGWPCVCVCVCVRSFYRMTSRMTIVWKHDVIHSHNYRNAASGWPSRSHRQHAQKLLKFGRVTFESRELANKHTNMQTLSKILRITSGGKVIKYIRPIVF